MSWIITGTQKNSFTPADITTALWLDGSDNSTIFSDAGVTPATNGSSVYQWNDKSGNGRNVTQTTLGNRPAFTTNSLNGKSAITFADNSRWMLGAAGDESAFDYTSELYFFCVCQISASGSNVITNKGRLTYNNNGWYVDINNTNQALIGFTAPASYSSIDTGSSLSLNTDIIISFEANNATVRSRLNGVTKSTTVVNKASWAATTNNQTLSIGAYQTSGSATNFEGIMRQIIIMSSVPSLTDIQKLEGWAAHHYGLTANLPIDHPYKTAVPVP